MNAGVPERMRALLRVSWIQLVWLVLIFMAARYAMYLSFADAELMDGQGRDLLKMWITGLRYDGRVAGSTVLFLFGLGAICSLSAPTWSLFRKLAFLILGLSTLLVAGFAQANYYYYDTFQNFIDIFAFGFFGENKMAVAENFWDDYPALRMAGSALLVSIIPAFWGYFTLKERPLRQLPGMRFNFEPRRGQLPGPLLALICLISAGTFFIAARGSVGTFPFGRDDNQISRIDVLNKLAPNGIIAFDWAFKDYLKDVKFVYVAPEKGLELQKLAGLGSLRLVTPQHPWLDEHKPHVVAVMMESLGSNMLNFDSPPGTDLLGALREHFDSDFLFHRFLPENNGTAPSFAAMFFLSPVQNISHSSAQKSSLSYTPFKVYKKAGYKTVFVHPGNMMWRNMAGYMPLQGVDELYDLNDMIRMFPEAAKQRTAWGVPDEYAYKLTMKLLEQSDEPLFIAILTVTNHPPYAAPPHYKPGPLAQTPDFLEHAMDGGIELHNILTTFQYANDAAGQFISAVKNSGLGERTLIAVTGDHQMRRLKSNDPEEKFLNLAVPFYLYIPGNIQDRLPLLYDPERPGSHKDIMPTLYNYSLSEAEYLALGGRNLLAERDDPERAYGYNQKLWIDDKGAYQPCTRTFFTWDESNPLLLDFKMQLVTDKAMLNRMEAYPELLRWQLHARATGLPIW